MKTVTIRVGSVLAGELDLEGKHSFVTVASLVLNVNGRVVPVVTKMPLVLQVDEPLTITVTESKGAPGKGR